MLLFIFIISTTNIFKNTFLFLLLDVLLLHSISGKTEAQNHKLDKINIEMYNTERINFVCTLMLLTNINKLIYLSKNRNINKSYIVYEGV